MDVRECEDPGIFILYGQGQAETSRFTADSGVGGTCEVARGGTWWIFRLRIERSRWIWVTSDLCPAFPYIFKKNDAAPDAAGRCTPPSPILGTFTGCTRGIHSTNH